MGTWSSGLYANDTTCDVKDTYIKFLKDQLSNEGAYQKTVEVFREYLGDEEEPFFWYVLADTQWHLGRLKPEVKAKALEWIENDGGLFLWEESKHGGVGWKKTLQKLKMQLISPMPPEKKIKKTDDFVRNPWNIGDIYLYRFHSIASKEAGLFGKYIPFQKIADEEWCDGWILSRIQIYDKIFDKLSTSYDLSDVRILPFDKPDLFITGKRDTDEFPLCLNALMIRSSKRDYPEKHFTFIGSRPEITHLPFAHPNISNYEWRGMENAFLCVYYQAWRKYGYKIRDGKSYIHLI